MTVSELKILFEFELKGFYPNEEADSLFDYVLAEITANERISILVKPSYQIEAKTEQKVYSILNKLKQYIPVQYIFGKAHFYGLELNVTPAILIPRPETEELVDWIIKENKGKKLNILDAGTGSGCIALALKKNLPACSVTGIDVSTQAVEVARNNASLLGIDVEFKEADIVNPSQYLNEATFDIIVSNPPYIKDSDKEFVGKNVMLHEPHAALFVPEDNPLIFYKAILEYSRNTINKAQSGVTLYFEIHENAAKELMELCGEMGCTNVIVRKDLSGKERMLKCTILKRFAPLSC